MGKLIRQGRGTTEEIYLCREHTVGRDPGCGTVLSGVSVSRLHGRIFWQRGQWFLRDLGSRNGTHVNERPCDSGIAYPLNAGDQILFGDDSETWILQDVSEPRSMLLPVNKAAAEEPILLENLVALPSEDQPDWTIFGTGNGTFEMENASGARVELEHGQHVTIDGNEYRVHLVGLLSGLLPETKTAEQVSRTDITAKMQLNIAVAPDEESAAVTLCEGQARRTLPPRVHLYLLAHLARLRISETEQSTGNVAAGLGVKGSTAGDDHGWIDCRVLCNDLKIEVEYLTQQVFRIRQDFKKLSIFAAEMVIDRRLRGKMRIGFPARKLKIGSLS